MHNAPWAKTSTSAGQFSQMARVSSAEHSRAMTTRSQPSGAAQLRRHAHALQGVEAHLGAGVQGQVRQGPAQEVKQPPVLHQHRVHPQAGGRPGGLQGRRQFPVRHQGVQGQKDPDAPLMAVGQGIGKLLVGKIFRAPAGVEGTPAQIDGVRPALDRCPQGLRGPGGGKQLRPHPRFLFWASSFCWRRKTSRFSSLASLWALPASSR